MIKKYNLLIRQKLMPTEKLKEKKTKTRFLKKKKKKNIKEHNPNWPEISDHPYR